MMHTARLGLCDAAARAPLSPTLMAGPPVLMRWSVHKETKLTRTHDLSLQTLSTTFGPFGPRFAQVFAPATPPESIEETWIVRASPLGPSGRMLVEARPHRRAAWQSDPDTWPEAVRVLAKAHTDRQGRAVSRRPYMEWLGLSGARTKARRVIEVALQAVRALVVPLVAWVEAVVETSMGTITARVRKDAKPEEREAFWQWAQAHTPHRWTLPDTVVFG